jgi:nucleoside-diphosphate-sugar epimerase
MVKPKAVSFPLELPCSPAALDEFLSQPSAGSVDAMRGCTGPVMVLGAGGKMGLHLSMMLQRALVLAGRNDRVMAVSRFRTLRDREAFAAHGVETVACDLEVAEEVAKLPDAPTVFFLAGVKFGTATAPDLLQRVNAQMPRRVLERFSRSTFVAFSTGCVYPFVAPSTHGATEETPPQPNGEYAASCLAREDAFVDASRSHGTKSVLIRLNYSVEFRYGLLVDVALKVLRGESIDVTMGYANAIWQTDALNYAIQALELAAAPPVPLNVTGPDTFSVREIANRFGELLHRPVHIVGAEADTAWLNNAARSHQRFWLPATSLDTMLSWVAAWLASGGAVWGKPTGFERRDGNF